MNKLAANINSLGTVIQNDILLNYFNGKTFKELSNEERQLFNNYFNKKKIDIENNVNLISDNPQYISWIYDIVMSGNLTFPENIEKARNVSMGIKRTLISYDNIKRSDNFSEEYKNILNFKTLEEMVKVVKENQKLLSKGEKVHTYGNNKIVYNNNGIQVLRIVDYEESNYLFNGTALCIKEKDKFDELKPPFYLFIRNNVKYALLHFDSRQLRNVSNERFESIDKNFADAIFFIFEKYDNKNSNLIHDFDILFNLLDDDKKRKYLGIQLSRRYISLGSGQFGFLTDEQKNKYIDNNGNIDDDEFKFCNDEQKMKVIINNKEELSDEMFKWCNDDLKKSYIDSRISKGEGLTPLQKKYYKKLKVKASNSNRLWNSCFNNNYIGKL